MWDVNTFLFSYIGMYAVQTVIHSITASFLTDLAIIAWKVSMPANKQRLRFAALFLPLLMFPIYQLLNPDRGSIYFRFHSLTDINKWLSIEVYWVPLYALFAAVCLFTTIVFVVQELMPMIMQFVYSRSHDTIIGDADQAGSEDNTNRVLREKIQESNEAFAF